MQITYKIENLFIVPSKYSVKVYVFDDGVRSLVSAELLMDDILNLIQLFSKCAADWVSEDIQTLQKEVASLMEEKERLSKSENPIAKDRIRAIDEEIENNQKKAEKLKELRDTLLELEQVVQSLASEL